MNDDQQQTTLQQDEGQNEQQGNQAQGSKVDFTPEQQAAIDNMIAEKVAKERQKAEQAKQDAIKKAEERAKMTAEERAKAEREDQQKAIKEQQAELNRQMREFSTKNMLLDKGISVDLLPLVMGADDDETSQRLDLLKKYRDKEVQAATEKLMSGKKAPSAGNGGTGVSMSDNPWSDQAWNVTKQQQIYDSDPEKARQMIAQAQPKRAFYIGMNN